MSSTILLPPRAQLCIRYYSNKHTHTQKTKQNKEKDDLEMARLAAETAANKLAAEAKKLAVETQKTERDMLKYKKAAEKNDFEQKERKYLSEISKLNKETLNAAKAYEELEQQDAARAARILELERELKEHKAATSEASDEQVAVLREKLDKSEHQNEIHRRVNLGLQKQMKDKTAELERRQETLKTLRNLHDALQKKPDLQPMDSQGAYSRGHARK
jgi:hypothetical protein